MSVADRLSRPNPHLLRTESQFLAHSGSPVWNLWACGSVVFKLRSQITVAWTDHLMEYLSSASAKPEIFNGS